MAFDFPASPTIGQQYSPVAGATYVWNGYAWALTPGLTIVSRQFVASDTYTPTPNLVFAVVECVGGGAGGGGATSTTSVFVTGGGGGSGGYSRKTLTAAQIGASQTITIGAGGTGGNPGGNGGATSFGSLCVANGGVGGTLGVTAGGGLGGAGGSVGTGDVVAAGMPGLGGSIGSATIAVVAPNGGSGPWGGGGRGRSGGGGGVGNNASNYGGGGGGATSFNADGGFAGGNGSAGIVIITEYVGNQPIIAGGNVMGAGVPSVGQLAEWTSSSAIQGVEGRGRLILITTQTAGAAVASVDFTSGIDATYDEYELHMFNVFPTTSGTGIILRVSTNAGASWDAGTNYQYAGRLVQSSGTGTVDFGATASAHMHLGATGGTVSASNPFQSIVKFNQPAVVRYHAFDFQSSGQHVTNGPFASTGSGWYIATTAINGVRVLAGSGNITGTFILYGRKK